MEGICRTFGLDMLTAHSPVGCCRTEDQHENCPSDCTDCLPMTLHGA